MWKRLQHQKGARQPAFMAEDDIQEENGNWASETRASRPARPPRPPVNELPPLPFAPVQNITPTNQNGSKLRPASSIYSQPSPNPATGGRFPPLSVRTPPLGYTEEVEISPPSSPEVSATAVKYVPRYEERPASPEVSPIDEMPPPSELQTSKQDSRPTSSSIPVLRREKRRNLISETTANVRVGSEAEQSKVGQKTHGNSPSEIVTGEPMTDSRGRPAQMPLSGYDALHSNAVGNHGVPRPLMSPKGQNSFGDRIRKLKEGTLMQASRPEWKGASGRSNPVEPVFEQINVKPLQIPRKSSKRGNSPPNSGSNTPLSGTGTSHVSSTTHGYSVPTIQTIVPPVSEQNKTDRVASPTHYNNPSSPTSLHRRPLPPNSAVQTAKIEKEDSTSTIEKNLREALKNVNIQSPQRNEPASRFSVSTYATSAFDSTADSTPRASCDSPPPVPDHQPALSPVLNRRRPKVGSSFDSADRSTTRKAVADPIFISMSTASTASRRNSKALPKSPAEEQSVDLISSLQAQLDNLARCRANLQRAIFQMTELMPPDTVGLGRGMEALRQQEEKRKVEELRADLADVVREEHELGLRLHRAWKRKDQQAVYEPTTLWVRRVTG